MYYLNKYFGIANIKDYPLRKLVDFLQYAYEKEIYERWLTLYPLIEAGIINSISFNDYKNKILENIKSQQNKEKLTDEQIINQGMKIVEAYEKQQNNKAGERIGNI